MPCLTAAMTPSGRIRRPDQVFWRVQLRIPVHVHSSRALQAVARFGLGWGRIERLRSSWTAGLARAPPHAALRSMLRMSIATSLPTIENCKTR